MKKFVYFILLFLGTSAVYGQAPAATHRLSITVRNEANIPLQGAVIELMREGEGQPVGIALVDSAGIGLLESIRPASYFIKASMVGYESFQGAVFTLTLGSSAPVLPGVVMKPKKSNELQGVTVTAKKPLIQRLNDRLVVNVQNNILSTGGSALEVLERSPGISVDNNETISLRGNPGVVVMINGKVTPMSSKDLTGYLSTLPASELDRIEIITNPSARYDASGNAGIIDIRLKKDQRLGTNGAVSLSLGKGRHHRGTASGSFNYRNKWMNLFASHSYNLRKNVNHVTSALSFYKNGTYNGGYNQDNETIRHNETNTARVGADLFLSKLTSVGVVFSGTANNADRANNLFSQVFNSGHAHDGEMITRGCEDSQYDNFTYSTNLKHQFGESGKELTADYDYATYTTRNNTFLHTTYALPNTLPASDYKLQGFQTNKVSLSSLRMDYSQPLGKSVKIEGGIKSSIVKIDNDQQYYNQSASMVYDSSLSNHFLYSERISAAYLSASKEYKKVRLQLGLRGEQIHLEGKQEVGHIAFDSSYTQLFPSAFLTYKLNPVQSIGVSVSRRIERPNYAQLNPFRTLLDPTLIVTGNPNLLPQLSWSYELNYAWKQWNLIANYSHTTNQFNSTVVPDTAAEKVSVQKPINMSNVEYYSMTLLLPYKFTKSWSMINNVTSYYRQAKSGIDNEINSRGSVAINLTSNHQFTFSHGWSAEAGVSFRSANRYAFERIRERWFIDAGIQKLLFNGKGTLRFNATDLFWTNKIRFATYFKNYEANWQNQLDSRSVNLTFSYKLGKSTAAPSKRKSAAEEERKRLGE